MTETEKKWTERVREWRESGKRAEDFAAGQPYKASTLRWWGTQLRRRSEGDGRRREAETESPSIPMARVVVRRAEARPPGVEHVDAERVVVEISGARITLARGFDTELFSEVIRVLGRAR